MFVNPEDLNYSVETADADHLGNPPWYVQIKADFFDKLSKGSSGLEENTIMRELEIHLTPVDLKELLDFAMKSGLLESYVKVRDVD